MLFRFVRCPTHSILTRHTVGRMVNPMSSSTPSFEALNLTSLHGLQDVRIALDFSAVVYQ